MDDLTDHRQSPADEDPVLHGYLASLPRIAPMPGFEERVLSRVYWPTPAPLRRFREYLRSPAGVRAWWTAWATFAVGGLVFTITLAVAVATLGARVAAPIASATTTAALGAWATVQQTAVGWSEALDTMVGAVLPTTGSLLAAAAATLLVWATCAVGLLRLMKTSTVRSTHAAR